MTLDYPYEVGDAETRVSGVERIALIVRLVGY
jgi:hypothetical protein